MLGRCTKWDYEKSVGWLMYRDSTGDGAGLFVHFSEIPEDGLGRRYLLVGEDVEFEIAVGSDSRPCAKHVIPIKPRNEEDPDEYWEEGFVEQLKLSYGAVLRRPAGGWIFLHKQDAKTRVPFAKEQVWRYRVAPPVRSGVNWQAVDAELLGMLDE